MCDSLFSTWIDYLYENNAQGMSLAFRFFVVFSRFEYALKKIEYYKTYNNRRTRDKPIFAYWKGFALDNKEKFHTMLQGNEASNAAVVKSDDDRIIIWNENLRLDGETLMELLAKLRKKALKDAVNYMINHPPRKQVKLNDHEEIIWKENLRQDGESLMEWLGRLIRTVRNNLFHGGKELLFYPVEDIGDDKERDASLLESCLIILRCWLELNEDLKSAFLGDFEQNC